MVVPGLFAQILNKGSIDWFLRNASSRAPKLALSTLIAHARRISLVIVGILRMIFFKTVEWLGNQDIIYRAYNMSLRMAVLRCG